MASLDRRQSNEILRRSSLLDSLDTEQAKPMKRDLDDPDGYHDWTKLHKVAYSPLFNPRI